MNSENPTPLRVGATGTLNGWRERVAGRVVLGVEIDGETYTWNEFHLVDHSGNSATLVFEEGESEPEWKIFREFTPVQSMTAHEAAAKRVGDTVNLDGSPVKITLVDQSKVMFIEGRAMEGVEVGDIAHYFNADTGSRMLVASWSDDEIEFYEGLDAPAASVTAAFGLAPDSNHSSRLRPTDPSDGNAARGFRDEPAGASGSGSGRFIKIAVVLLGAASLFGAYSCFSSGGSRVSGVGNAPAQTPTAPAPRLTVGSRGTIGGRTYVMVDQKTVRIARTAGRHDNREYLLREEIGTPALLINGLSGGTQEWHLLRATPASPELTPFAAAAKKKGQTIPVGDHTARVTDLFQAMTSGGDTPKTAVFVQYGFVARDGATWFLARWTEQQLLFFSGEAVPESDVLKAFDSAFTPTK
ncbi:MAG: DUF4178 domain-containing protein [Opitutaceae bacterium]